MNQAGTGPEGPNEEQWQKAMQAFTAAEVVFSTCERVASVDYSGGPAQGGLLVGCAVVLVAIVHALRKTPRD
jgi:hypothetical protein